MLILIIGGGGIVVLLVGGGGVYAILKKTVWHNYLVLLKTFIPFILYTDKGMLMKIKRKCI